MAEEPSYLEPLRNEAAALDERIERLGGELDEAKTRRRAIHQALYALDPVYAEQHKPKPKPKPKGETYSGYSPERLAEVTATLGGRYQNGASFRARDVSELTGIHETTIQKILRDLHDQGAIRLDHMGGQRNTTRFYRLVAND